MKKTLITLLITLMVSGMLVGCAAPAPSASPAASAPASATASETAKASELASAKAEPIKIGVTMPVTGSFANMGVPEQEGIITAAYVINQKGGINGRPVELVLADTPDVAAAKGETDRLINQEKVVAVIGTYSSTLSLAVAETCNRYNTLYFEGSSYGTAISKSGFKTTIRHSANSDQVGEMLVDELIVKMVPQAIGKNLQDLKIAFASEDGVWGKNSVASNMELLKKNQLDDNVVLTEYYSADTKDLSTMILKLKALQPDILFLFGYEQDSILFVRQSKELGFQVPVICGAGGGLAMKTFGESLGTMANGIISSDFPPLPPQTNKDALPGLDDYLKAYKEIFKKDASGIYGHTLYGSAMVFFEGLAKAKSLSTDDLIASFYALDIPKFGTTSGFGAKYEDINGHKALNTRAFPYLVQWQNGKLYVIAPTQAAGAKPMLPKPAF